MGAATPQRRFLWAVAFGAIIAANVAVFAPVTLYKGNADEFSVSLAAVLGVYWLPAASFAVAVGLLGAALRGDAFQRFAAVAAALACLLWLQGNILVWDYGPLDGSPIPWLATGWRGLIDTGLWVCVLLLALHGYRRFGGLLAMAAGLTFCVQAAALALLSGPDAQPVRAQSGYDPEQHQAMFRFSPERNVLHIVMDGFQSDVFAEIVRDPANAAIADALSGFTFFEDHMGAFPYTEMTMPLLTSGRLYQNHLPREEFVAQAMRGETILSVAGENGFEVDVASQIGILNVYTQSEYTNVFNIPENQHTSTRDYVLSDAVRLMDLSLFRLAPHFLKAYIYQDDLWFLKRFARNPKYLRIRYFSELLFLRQVRDNLVVDRRAPTYKLFHLMLAHRPTVGNERCEYDEVKRPARLAVTLQARCGLLAIAGVLQRMKELDVFDNTVVVLMADHGAWLPASGFAASEAAADRAPSAITAGMAVPTLAIKPMHAQGPLEVSRAPTTMGDVPRTIADLIGAPSGLAGVNVFDVPEGVARSRKFYDYAFGKNAKAPGYLHTMLEYEVIGSPFEAQSWRRTRRLRPAGEVEVVANTGRSR